jgi:uncharacterized SAM-binding protein YcdF (DUF218 family)
MKDLCGILDLFVCATLPMNEAIAFPARVAFCPPPLLPPPIVDDIRRAADLSNVDPVAPQSAIV